MADLKKDLDRLMQKGWINDDSRQLLEQTTSYNDPDRYSQLLKTCRDIVCQDIPVAFHPIMDDLASLCAMAFILKTNGYNISGADLAQKLRAEIQFITDAYVDEESPYPFQEVSDERKRQMVIRANTKLLERFLANG